MVEMRRDTLLGVAWAAGLVLAMVSVFLYGLSAYEPARFDVAWADHEDEQIVEGRPLQEGDERTHVFEADGKNVTQVRIVLEWSDDVGQNDRFVLRAEGPEGAIDTDEGEGDTVELTFPVAARPEATEAEGANADHAIEQMGRDADPWNGIGQWNVTVRLQTAPGTPGTQGLVGAQADGANGYTLRFVRVTTDAMLTPR